MASSDSSTKVVLMGKGGTKGDNSVFDIIKNIETKRIPSDLLYCVFVTIKDGSRFKVNRNAFGNLIEYSTMEKQLESLKIDGEITLVEIVVDLSKAQNEIERKTEEFLSQYF